MHELTDEQTFALISIINPNAAFKKYQCYRDYVLYDGYHAYCRKELQRLRSILHKSADLETDEVKYWITKNTEIFFEKLYSLFIEDDSDLPYILLDDLGEKILKRDFAPQLSFCKVMDCLHTGQYNILPEYRVEPDPNDYYYQAPDPQAPTDIDYILQIIDQ